MLTLLSMRLTYIAAQSSLPSTLELSIILHWHLRFFTAGPCCLFSLQRKANINNFLVGREGVDISLRLPPSSVVHQLYKPSEPPSWGERVTPFPSLHITRV